MEEEEITTSKIVWTRLIDVENCLIGIKGMKAESNEACFYKLEHIMVRGKQPTYQRERSIRLIAENGKDMIIDPKPREITPATMCWPIEGHLDQLSWNPTMYLWRTQGQTNGAKLVQIFRYNTKIGRQIILEQEHDKIAAKNFIYRRALVKCH